MRHSWAVILGLLFGMAAGLSAPNDSANLVSVFGQGKSSCDGSAGDFKAGAVLKQGSRFRPTRTAWPSWTWRTDPGSSGPQ